MKRDYACIPAKLYGRGTEEMLNEVESVIDDIASNATSVAQLKKECEIYITDKVFNEVAKAHARGALVLELQEFTGGNTQ